MPFAMEVSQLFPYYGVLQSHRRPAVESGTLQTRFLRICSQPLSCKLAGGHHHHNYLRSLVYSLRGILLLLPPVCFHLKNMLDKLKMKETQAICCDKKYETVQQIIFNFQDFCLPHDIFLI